MLNGYRGLGWLIAGGLCLGAACAQRPVKVGELTSADTTTALTGLAARAGVIFTGHVLSITRNDAAGYVDIRFVIDRAVSGCSGASEYGVREWSGLWSGQAPRYQVGQRFLMMLHSPGASGMSAPVGGVDGAIPLIASTAGPVMDASGTVAPDTGQGALSGLAVDLRWLRARALRTAMVRSATARSAVDNIAVGGPAKAPLASIGEQTPVTLETVLAILSGVGSGAY